MRKNLTSIMKSAVGEDSHRHSKRGRHHSEKPPREDMGNWIWIDGTENARNSYLYARKLFEIKGKPTKAVIKASSDAQYKLYVNGDYIGKGPVRSIVGYTYYDTFDVTEHLSKGKNVIAFHAHHIGENTNYCTLKRPGLICKAEIEVGEDTLVFGTDESWKVHKADDYTNLGARVNESLGFQEVYDAALRLEGWNEIKFKEKGWEDAVVVGNVPSFPWGKLIDREIPPLQEELVYADKLLGLYNSPERSIDTPPAEVPEIMATAELEELKSGSVKGPESIVTTDGVTHVRTGRDDKGVVILLDFGSEVYGNFEIGVDGSGTATIDIGYGEMLEDGRVKTNRHGLKCTDRVVLKKGRLAWQSFETRAFRYVQLEFRRCSKAVALDYVRVNQTTYPVQLKSDFECSDPLLNEVWNVAAYTAKLCMEDTFIDCPWRERAQWWGDARVLSRSAYYAFDETALLAQGLRQIADLQGQDGSLPGMYPGGSDKLVPDFSLYWIFSLLDYYAFADDAGPLRELYPNVKALLFWFEKFVDSDGLLSGVPGWLFIDWADIDKREEITVLNCLYYQALRVASAIAGLNENEADFENYTESANKLRIAINKFLYSPKKGLYADCRVGGKMAESFSRQTNVLAALFDVPDHYRKSTIQRQLVGSALPDLNTPYFVSQLLEVLYSGDRHVDALHIIRKKWGEMVRAGASTFWEFFNQEEGSLCHGWSSGPARDLIAEFVGIKPVLGAHRFSVTPHTGDLKWARGFMNTKAGRLTVEWKVIRGAFVLTLEVPEGLKVDVYPPCPADCTLSVDGKAYAAKFVTFGGGNHTIRATFVKPPKVAPEDASLKPIELPHVEILEDIMPRSRRRTGITTTRRRTGRKGEAQVEVGADVEPLDVSALPVGEAEETADETENGKKSRRRRSRRGGKGRPRTGETVESVEAVGGEPAAPGAEVEAKTEPGEAATAEEGAEGATRSRRRRSRRGGRSRGRSGETQEAEATATPEAESVSVETATEESIAAPEQGTGEEPHKHRRRRSRRGRGRSASAEGAENEVVAETGAEAAPMETTAAESAETSTEQAEEARRPRRRRSRRGGRGRVPSTEGAETEVTSETGVEVAPAEIATAESVEPSAEQTEEAHRSRRRRSRRGGRGRSASGEVGDGSVASPEESAPAEAVIEPQSEITGESTDESTKPRRRRTRRGGRAHTEHAESSVAGEFVGTEFRAPEVIVPAPIEQPQAPVASEQAGESPEAPKKKPVRRRRPAKPSVEQIGEAPSELPKKQPEPPAQASTPAAEEAPKKKRTYTRKPRKTAESEGTDSAGS